MNSERRELKPSDLFSLKFVRDAQFSPDGNRLVVAISRTDPDAGAEYCELYLYEFATAEMRPIVSGRLYATEPRWSPSGRHIASVVRTAGGTCLSLYSLDTDSSEYLDWLDVTVGGTPAWSNDGERLVLSAAAASEPTRSHRLTRRIPIVEALGYTDDGLHGICVVNLTSRIVSKFFSSDWLYSAPKWSSTDQTILVLAKRFEDVGLGRGFQLGEVSGSHGKFRLLLSDPWQIECAEPIPGVAKLVISGSHNSREGVPAASLWVFDTETGTVDRRSDERMPHIGFRFHHDMPTLDLPSRIALMDENHAIATVQYGGQSKVCEVALVGPICCRDLAETEMSTVAISASPTSQKYAYWSTSLASPSELLIGDLNKPSSALRVTGLNADTMRAWPEISVRHFWLDSHDGEKIEAWYLSRADLSGPQPSVMFIHGGPYIAIGQVFRFDFYLLAANGIGVLFGNFRGSLGYGSNFSLAIDPDWGAQGYHDHIAIAHAGINLDLVDGERFGVWGPSHGGFATAWIVGHTGMFRAALVEAAPTDWAIVYYLSDLPDFFAGLLGGTPSACSEVYAARSPVSFAHVTTTPTMIIHGENDIRCPLAGALKYYRALIDAGCPTEMRLIENCNHLGDSTGPLSARLSQNEALLHWFKKHLRSSAISHVQ